MSVALFGSVWLRSAQKAMLLGMLVCLGLASSSADLSAGEGKITGMVKYEKIPYLDPKSGKPGLLRDRPQITPVGRAKVELVTKEGEKVLAQTITAKDGSYEMAWKVEGEVNAFVRVWAKADNAEVRNFFKKNTNFSTVSKPLVLSGKDVTQNLLALEKTHEAGAFNILAVVCQCNEFLHKVEPDIKFPAIKVYWAPGANTFTQFNASRKEAFILGMRDEDADEFDDFVLAHEYGHFVMSVFSRDDTPGGMHGHGQKVDARLAWSEGWANFFASAVLNDAHYVDTRGPAGKGPAVRFNLDVSRPKGDKTGYWSEHTVGSTLWHLIAKTPGENNLGIPFKDLWAVVRGPWAKHPHGSLIDFCDMLVASKPELGPGVAKVMAAHNIKYSPGKTPSMEGYTYQRPLTLGMAETGTVDAFTARYQTFDGIALYKLTLDKKTKVRLSLDVTKSAKPDASEIGLIVSSEKGRIAPKRNEYWAQIIERELEPGSYVVEVRSWIGNRFNTATYRLLAEVAGDDKNSAIVQKLTPEQLRTILKDFGYTVTTRSDGADVKLGGKYQATLQCVDGGKVLVIGCNDFKKAGLDRINKWNDDRALSRAIGRPEFSRLEADLNCDLGVTPTMVHRFLQNYRMTLEQFEGFIGKGGGDVAKGVAPGDGAKAFTPADVEKFIKDVMKTTAQKMDDPNTGVTTYGTPDNFFDVVYDGGKKTVTFQYVFGNLKAGKAKLDEWNRKVGKTSRATVFGGRPLFFGTISAEGLTSDKLKALHDLLKKEQTEFLTFINAPG